MPDQEQMVAELLRRQPLDALQKAQFIGADPLGDSQWTLAQVPINKGDIESLKALVGRVPGIQTLRKFLPEELMSQGEDLYQRMVQFSRPIQTGRTVKDYNPADYADKFKFGEHGGNFYTEKFPHTADVRVHHPGLFSTVEMDQVKGLNAGHAGARAAAGNPNAERVRLVTREPSMATLDRPSDAETMHPSEQMFHYLDRLVELLGRR